MKTIYALLIACFLFSSVAFATTGPVTTAGTMTVCNGNPISVPVTVAGFNNVGGISLTLNYDPAILSFTSVTLHPAIAGSFTNGATPGTFILSYTCNPGIGLPDNTPLFTLNFGYAGPPSGGTSSLTWKEIPVEDNEYSSPQGIAYSKDPFGSYFINGSVTVTPGTCAPVTTAPVVTTCPSSSIAVPVKVNNFNNVGGISLTLTYDPAILAYQGVDLNPAITGSFTNGTIPGTFILSYTCDPGIALPNNTTLFNLKLWLCRATSRRNLFPALDRNTRGRQRIFHPAGDCLQQRPVWQLLHQRERDGEPGRVCPCDNRAGRHHLPVILHRSSGKSEQFQQRRGHIPHPDL